MKAERWNDSWKFWPDQNAFALMWNVPKELLYLAPALTDGDGNVATDRDELLTAEVTGAELLGFGSGAPEPRNNYNEGKTETWNGRAQMILRKKAGQTIDVTVTSASGKEAHLEDDGEMMISSQLRIG